jgi:hypothetical protein
MTLLASRTRLANCTLIAHGHRARTCSNPDREGCTPVTRAFEVERVTRIELALSAWEADVLPLNYTREARNLAKFAIYANRLGRTTVATSSYRNR